MVIPMGGTSGRGSMFGDGEHKPTPFALKMKWVTVFILILQCVIAIARFWMLDIWNGFMMIITVVVGGFTVHYDMHMLGVMMYGMINLVNAIFDTIRAVIAVVKNKPDAWHFFDKSQPWTYNFLHASIIAAPIIGLIAVRLMWAVYSDWSENQENEESGVYSNSRQGYGATMGAGSSTGGGGSFNVRPQQQFVPFSGGGQTLGKQ
mmetsp:Transcript_37708/g.90556  ORF Transcript_37708/g.90556 Transcript_37708/m.90556 type:complete len:205 (-) Transcript_37708:129-743(-)